MSRPDLTSLMTAFDRNWPRWLREWQELLRFPSIGNFPQHAADCRACAEWLAGHLDAMGLMAEILPTEGQPVVYAERPGKPGRPVVLLYGHYDVQPADPLAAWTTPPFEPTMRGRRLYARGAEDNKGQFFYVLKAIETLLAAQALDATVKIVLDGEEECGSRGLAGALPKWRSRLKADVLMVADTGTVASGAPTITMGLRGIAFVSFTLTGSTHDLHSGVHGGVAPNPALGMARLLATLHREDGSVAVPGFYEGVEPPTDQERALANESPIEAADYQAVTGAQPVGGEQAFTPVERRGFRPTIEVNGLHSGYGDRGTKTIIPAVAEAKLSARLVAGQKPESCLNALVQHLRQHTPAGLRFDVLEQSVAGEGFRLNLDSPLVSRARQVLDQVSPLKTAFLWEGASVPVVTALAAASGAEPLLIGFGHEEDRVHAPDESFSIDQFRQGFLYAALLLGGW